jgi:hypothetical protein
MKVRIVFLAWCFHFYHKFKVILDDTIGKFYYIVFKFERG